MSTRALVVHGQLTTALCVPCDCPPQSPLCAVLFQKEVRLHPATFLLLFAGPVLDVTLEWMLVITIVPTVTELVLNLIAVIYSGPFRIVDHVAISLIVIWAR